MTLGLPDLGPHAGFILGAYAFTALVMGGFILNAVRDQRAQKRALADLQGGAERDR
ncbi:heme exporter protein CcmD [Methylobacterium sp. A54F]